MVAPVRLFVFEKATNKVVAILQGPDGVSCEHYAGHVDETGKQPLCSSELGWQFEKFEDKTTALGKAAIILETLGIPAEDIARRLGDLNKTVALKPHTMKPREIGEGEMVNPRLVYEHEHEGQIVGRYLRKLNRAQLKGTAPIVDVVLEHDEHELIVDENTPIIDVPKFEHDGEIGEPGGPHRMSQEQFARHVKQTQEELRKVAARHGNKMTAFAFVFLAAFVAAKAFASTGRTSADTSVLLAAFGMSLVGVVGVMINIACRNLRANVITTALGASATVRAYNGTPPASPDTALSGNTLLAQGTYAATPYPGASNGTMTSNAITGANAAASGTPTFYASYATDGTTRVLQHNTTDFVVTPASLTSGVAVSWSAIVHTEPVGT